MSNQGSYDQSQGQHDFQSNNPWANSVSQNQATSHGTAAQQQVPQGQYEGYAPPQGPPPGQAPKRTETFKESDFVPEGERGEQREAMEQFEMSKPGAQSQQDRDVEMLQREYPGLDGSLIAAIHADSGGNMGATREMLQELASQTQSQQ